MLILNIFRYLLWVPRYARVPVPAYRPPQASYRTIPIRNSYENRTTDQ
jgi:hypothetical protein